MIPGPRHQDASSQQADEQRQIAHVREDLAREFTALPSDVVDDLVSRQLAAFSHAPVRSFVPVLVRRGAREQLRQLT